MEEYDRGGNIHRKALISHKIIVIILVCNSISYVYPFSSLFLTGEAPICDQSQHGEWSS